MLDADVAGVVKAIHATKTKTVVYTSGGAVQGLSWLLLVPGASGTILEANVPYARDAMMDALGGQEPQQYVSEATAVAMARAAYRRAAQLSPIGSHVVGLGATCSLATEPPKRGRCRAYIACHDGAKGVTQIAHLEFPSVPATANGSTGSASNHQLPYGVSRLEQDDLASRAVVKLLAEACGLHSGLIDSLQKLPAPTPPVSSPDPPAQCLLHASTLRSFSTSTQVATGAAPATEQVKNDALEALVAGQVECVEFANGEVTVGAPRKHLVLLPGSFNPLHQGHTELLAAAAASRIASGRGVAFELSVGNADKGVLPLDEVRRRVAQFTSAGAPVVVTRAPLFTHKAALFRDTLFVVGYDTAIRLVLPKYYGPPPGNPNKPSPANITAMLLEFDRLRQAGCAFLVAGRKDEASGQFLTLDDVQVPPELYDLFHPLPNFRVDLSSTQLRAQAAAAAAAASAAKA